jgi:hypothetical protein
MSDTISVIVIIGVFVSFIAVIILVIKEADDTGYKHGQIDALNGIQKYKLIEFSDGTRDYYKDPKPEDFTDEFSNFKIIK